MADRMTERKAGLMLALLVAASTMVEGGKMVARNSAGYVVEAADAAGLRVAGVANQTVDNSTGANGAKRVEVYSGQMFKFNNSTANAVDIADQGTPVWVEDDQTVADDPGTHGVVAGICVEVVSDGVWVYIPPALPQIAVQATSTAVDVAGIVANFNTLLDNLKASGIMFKA